MCHFTFKEMISAHFAKLNPQNLYVVVILVHLFTHLLHNVFPLKLSCRFSSTSGKIARYLIGCLFLYHFGLFWFICIQTIMAVS